MDQGCGYTLSHRVEVRLQLELSVAQRLHLQLRAQESLILALRGEHYKPEGKCPACGKHLSRTEIMRGFRRDPRDYTTRCPRCKHRFTPLLINWGLASRVEIGFYCPMQTLNLLHEDLLNLTVEQFRKQHPAIYHSAIYHFGSLKRAFAKIGKKYRFNDPKPKKWEKKVKPFLGRVSDTMIASIVGVTTREIRELRQSLDIRAFNR